MTFLAKTPQKQLKGKNPKKNDTPYLMVQNLEMDF